MRADEDSTVIAWMCGCGPLIKSGTLFRMYAYIYSRVVDYAGWEHGPQGDNIHLEPGQCLISIREASEALGIGKNTAHRAMKELRKMGFVSIHAGNSGSIFTVHRLSGAQSGANGPERRKPTSV